MNVKKPGVRVKHAPQRTCIGCRQVAGKRGLIRLVRTANGVEIDRTGKKAGRGAYIHPSRACWELVLRANRISQALRAPISDANRRQLSEYMETFPIDEPLVSGESPSVKNDHPEA